MRGAWKKRRNPFDKGLRANGMAVALDAGLGGGFMSPGSRSKCDVSPTIEVTAARAGEYVGTKICSPCLSTPVSERLASQLSAWAHQLLRNMCRRDDQACAVQGS